ncbi:hypothetical protein NB717_003045 [Xanthomonas sacchari]|nr:hypothetical protein [Xanthomonas sacchari]
MPVRLRRRHQVDTPHRRAGAAGIEQDAIGQAPVQRLRRLQHRRRRRHAGERGQLPLPLRQCLRIGVVHFQRREQRLCALRVQPVLHLPREAAELRVLAIAQAEHGVAQLRQGLRLAQHAAHEAARRVRRFAVAEGADHEQRALAAAQLGQVQLRQRTHLHRQPGRLQLRGGLPGQALGQAALAGKAHQPGAGGIADQPRQRAARGAQCALLAPAVQVQHPAGDEEQRHAQARQQHRHAPGQAEEAAAVQREHAGQQAPAQRLLPILQVAQDAATGRIDLHAVVGTVVRRIGRQVAGHDRLAAAAGQAQVQVSALRGRHGGEGRLQPRVVHCGWLPAAAAFLLLGCGIAAEHRHQPLPVPVVGPVQPGRGDQQVDQQTPGADHRVQAPQEAAPLPVPLHRPPGAPAPPAPRPAQVQAGQAEEDQHEGANPGDRLAALAGGQAPVQVFDEGEEPIQARRRQHRAGVGVEVQAAAVAAGQAHRGRPRAGRIDQHAVAAVRPLQVQAPRQFGQRQRLLAGGMTRGDGGQRRIGQAHDLVLEGERGPAQAHHRQHQPGADAEQPVQLEQQGLDHVGAVRDRAVAHCK